MATRIGKLAKAPVGFISTTEVTTGNITPVPVGELPPGWRINGVIIYPPGPVAITTNLPLTIVPGGGEPNRLTSQPGTYILVPKGTGFCFWARGNGATAIPLELLATPV